LVEAKYISLSATQIFFWRKKIEEQLISLKLFLDNAVLLKAKDDDISTILLIHNKLFFMESELAKPWNIRLKNKSFFSSYVSFLAKGLIDTLKTGLYDTWVIPKHIKSVMERTEV